MAHIEAWLEGVETSKVSRRDGEIWFGRGADLDLDSNPAMHRHVGRVFREGGRWFVENTSTSAPILVGGVGLAPGWDISLQPGVTGIQVTAGEVRYQLCVAVAGGRRNGPPEPAAGTTTSPPGAPALSRAQRRVLVALCAPYLKGERADLAYPVPTDGEIAAALFLAPSSVSEHMRALYEAFRRAGFSGLDVPRSADGQLQVGHRHGEMRRVLVAHAVGAGVVDASDLPAASAVTPNILPPPAISGDTPG